MAASQTADRDPAYLDSVTIHGSCFRTLIGTLPFDRDGFHWRAGTTRVERAVETTGEMASAVADDTVIAEGMIADVEVSPDGYAAVIHAVPPQGGEADGMRVDAITVPRGDR